MSLVNQMLRDLDKRRAGERHGSGTTFDGLISTGEPRRSGMGMFLAVALVAVVLGGAVGYLLWERRAPAPAAKGEVVNSVAALHSAVVAPPAAVPVSPGFVALEPAPERTVTPVVAGSAPVAPRPPAATAPPEAPRAVAAVAQPEPPRPAASAARKKEVTKSWAVVAPVAAPTPAAEPVAVVEKKPVPPTPQQMAAVAWQKGYEALGAGQNEEAERQLREALRQDPEHIAARESLAALLLSAGRRVEAGELLDQGLKFKPQVPSFRKLKARLQVEQNDLPGAVATLEGGLPGAVRDAEYQALLGALYQRQNRYELSMQRYEQALVIMPNQGVWWLGFAISAERAGQKSEAVAGFHRALDSGIGEKLAAYAKERLAVLEKS
jgi:MSHA biogenesis protein MshN